MSFYKVVVFEVSGTVSCYLAVSIFQNSDGLSMEVVSSEGGQAEFTGETIEFPFVTLPFDEGNIEKIFVDGAPVYSRRREE